MGRSLPSILGLEVWQFGNAKFQPEDRNSVEMVFEEKIKVEDVEINYARDGHGEKYILCCPNILGEN